MSVLYFCHGLEMKFEVAYRRCGFDGALTLLQTGENFKTTRKRMHGYIGSRVAAARFAELEEIETHRFLLHILDKPDDFFQHIRTYETAYVVKDEALTILLGPLGPSF